MRRSSRKGGQLEAKSSPQFPPFVAVHSLSSIELFGQGERMNMEEFIVRI